MSVVLLSGCQITEEGSIVNIKDSNAHISLAQLILFIILLIFFFFLIWFMCVSEFYKQKIASAKNYDELLNLPFVKEDEMRNAGTVSLFSI